MPTYIVTATLPSKEEIVLSVVTDNLLENEAIEKFKQFYKEQRAGVDLTGAKFRCVLAPINP